MRGAVSERGPCVRPVKASAETLRRLAYSAPAVFPVLLDSSSAGPLGRYSILGAFPQGELWQDALGVLYAQGLGGLPAQGSGGGFLGALQALWRGETRAAGTSADTGESPGPFRGGWMVFLGYEVAAEIEPQLSLPRAGEGRGAHAGPAAFALRIPAALVFDHLTDQAWLIAEHGREELLAAMSAALTRLPIVPAQPGAANAHAAAPLPPLELHEEPPERYRARVEAALEYIRAGDIYQANLSRPWRGEFIRPQAPSGLCEMLYERLRGSNPAPFAALAQRRDWTLLCSSPERLVRVCADRVETRPIAGTRPRSGAAGEDARELAALIAHPKERAEHVMLIDLERNDLGRICQPGSVHADQIMITESYAHVHHIVSNVSGRLLPDLTPIEVLRAVFPGGTITGCPKYRCMQIIAELEGEARAAYTGALGFINHDGSMDFNILIRTLTLAGPHIEFRAGAGIVADSQWRRELAETRAKARGLLAAIQSARPV